MGDKLGEKLEGDNWERKCARKWERSGREDRRESGREFGRDWQTKALPTITIPSSMTDKFGEHLTNNFKQMEIEV